MSRSAALMTPCSSAVVRTHSRSPPQYFFPTRTIGNCVTLWVCTRVMASKSSSKVPNPPGITMNPCAYFRNIVFRAKKYRKLIPRLTYSLTPCSKGSSIPRPTDVPPASAAPLFAASMMPGPPPVMTA